MFGILVPLENFFRKEDFVSTPRIQKRRSQKIFPPAATNGNFRKKQKNFAQVSFGPHVLILFSIYFAPDQTTKLQIMEQLNRLEIRGNVGNVSILKVGEKRVAHFSVATNFAYKGRNGDPIIETTWHNVTAWEGKGMPDLDLIQVGTPLYVRGRLRSQKYIANDGTEKTSVEVIAGAVELADGNVAVQYGS